MAGNSHSDTELPESGPESAIVERVDQLARRLARRTGARLVAIASLGGLLFGYETGEAAGALQVSHFAWTADEHVLLVTGTLLAAMFGALSAGRIADMVGRRDVIMATTAVFTMGAFLSAIAQSVPVLLIARVIVGGAVGAISVAAPLYIAEIAPTRRRGSMICVFQLMITIGILLAYVGNETFGQRANGWRVLLVGGAVPGLILSGLALLLLESPVWLALKGDQESALAVLDRLGRRDTAHEIEAIEARAPEDPSADLTYVFSVAGRAAIFIGIGLFFVQQFVGINAVIYYSVSSLGDLADALDFDLNDAPGLGLAAVNVLATLVAVGLIDRVGRRPLLFTSLVGIIAGLVTMAVAAGVHSSYSGAHFLSAAGLLVFIASFALGLGPIPWVAAAEILPIQVRGLAMSVVVASHWLFDSLASPTGQLLRHRWGGPVVLVLYALFALAGLVVFARRLPETKGLSFAAIDRFFTARAKQVTETRFIHYSVAVLATIGVVLTGYNFGITAVTLVLIDDDWHLSAVEKGALASALVVGLAAGSFLAGPLSDRFGRRYVLMSTAALFVASAFGAAVSPSLGWLLVARAGAGVAIGLIGPTAALYIAEVAPAAIRGRLLSFDALAYSVGVIVAYCFGIAFEHTAGGWRMLFGFIALPSTLYGLALLPLPESPRWLAAAGHVSAARRSLLRLVGVQTDRQAEADRELAAIMAERPGSVSDHDGGQRGWALLWQPRYRPAVLVGLAVVFLLVFSGIDMVVFYAPILLSDIGFGDRSVTFSTTLGLGVVSLVMTVVSVTIVDRVGRKPLMVTGLVVMSGCLIALALLTRMDHASGSVRWGQIASLATLAGTFSLTLGMVGEVVIAEMYPQSIRAPAASLAHGMRSVFAMIFTLTFPLLLDWPGLSVTVVGYAVISIVGAVYLLRNLPETRGRSLEDIGEYWSRRVEKSVARSPVSESAP